MGDVDTISANDVLGSLWNKNAVEKCRIGLADVIVYDDKSPRWYITGKNGEIKRNKFDMEAAAQRWKKIADQQNSVIACIIRQRAGILKFLTKEALDTLAVEPMADKAVYSIHCFVKGANRTVYRNKYDQYMGSVVTGTYAYKLEYDQTGIEAVSVMHDQELHLEEVQTTSLRSIMDLATSTVVKYVESMLSLKILSISIDYIVDSKSQLWMIWTSDAQVKMPAQESVIADVIAQEKRKKPSLQINAKAQAVPSPTSAARSPAHAHGPLRTQSPKHVRTTSPTSSSHISPKSHLADRKGTDLQPSSSSQLSVVSLCNTDLNCKGDYCNFLGLKSNVQLVSSMFSELELAILKKDTLFSKMVDLDRTVVDLVPASVSIRSIQMARNEQRGLKTNATLNAKLPFEEQANQFQLERTKREASVAAFSESVRVCNMCYNMYMMLDWARGVLGASSPQTRDHLLRGATPPHAPGSLVALMKKKKGETSDIKLTALSSPGGTEEPLPLSDHASTVDASSRRTWKQHSDFGVTTERKKIDKSKLLDIGEYLCHGAVSLASKKSNEKDSFVQARVDEIMQESGFHPADPEAPSVKSPRADSTESQPKFDITQSNGYKGNVYRAKVLFACEENVGGFDLGGRDITAMLQKAFFDVQWVKDGRETMNCLSVIKESVVSAYDCILLQRDLPLLDAFDIVSTVRDFEKKERDKTSIVHQEDLSAGICRVPIICLAPNVKSDDLKRLMLADMDGCVSLPVQASSLINTVRSAAPQHLAPLRVKMNKSSKDGASVMANPSDSKQAKVFKLGALGVVEGDTASASQAMKSMSFGKSAGAADEFSFEGIVQIDADTRVPYTILDASRNVSNVVRKPFINLVVCHDLFDTNERHKIFFKPIVQKYVGLQVLLWNYPGQAFSEWRSGQLLSNEYLSVCLNELLGQLGEKGTFDFDTTRPFYIMGYGFGASVAAFYAAHYRVPNLRGLLLVNSWTYVDSYLAGVMRDCITVFENSPASRPDLPVYFFSRFIFSKEYLARVSVPLALNIYTAVYNPISVKGRVSLCKGVLQSVDLRPLLRDLDVPVICLHGTQDLLARPMHTEAYTRYRGGDVRSVFKALQDPSKTCIIWMKCGHEMFQESRKHSQVIIEQLITGFHESHDVSFSAVSAFDASNDANDGIAIVKKETLEPDKYLTVEDNFINSVLKKVGLPSEASKLQTISASPTRLEDKTATFLPPISRRGKLPEVASSVLLSASDPETWLHFSDSVSDAHVADITSDHRRAHSSKEKKNTSSLAEAAAAFPVDPTSVSFARDSKSVYAAKDKANRIKVAGIQDFPEVKEYMDWRLKRNKKRLLRLDAAARSIQCAFRAHTARMRARRMRRYKATVTIQRIFRGWLGRHVFLQTARELWAMRTIQRIWRGHAARRGYFELVIRVASAVNVQRAFRGHRARLLVANVRRIRKHAATVIQALFRRRRARDFAWHLRLEFNSCVTIQRIIRGFLGRKKATAERDKYIFSKSQTQGIEFGRQMLLEHKLHATRLQSDVSLLTQEKKNAEDRVEALLEEISGFEEGVRTLEKEMHQLSKIEAETAAFLDGDAKYELREQKIRLDKEFGEMLTKIAGRKDTLTELERRLGVIDKSRQGKEEELRTLERKLVVLLEEQQNELNAIKKKQDARGVLLAASHNELTKASKMINAGSDSQALVVSNAQALQASGGGYGAGMGGPSVQEKRQAAQLMQSTETLMKFGFMSMSMTYFSSLNMIKALRTVSAQDTVMAALADVQMQRAAGFGTAEFNGSSGSSASVLGGAFGGPSQGKGPFFPDLKPGQVPGQEGLRVSSWSVNDVARWLKTISLGQYVEAFIDGAVDGESLYDINDDDLKSTLGIEHRLHRKKILNCVHRLKIAEVQRDHRLMSILRETGSLGEPLIPLDEEDSEKVTPTNPFASGANDMPISAMNPGMDRKNAEAPKVSLDELFSFVRHSKVTLLKEALDYLPSKSFDETLVQAQYLLDFGTIYVDGYDRLPFNINKTDSYGNTMMSLACQNGNLKICKYLLFKGANINHQNKQGQTPAHYAIAYKFFDLSKWLFENGANDLLQNKWQLTPYDGLTSDEIGDGDLAIVAT